MQVNVFGYENKVILYIFQKDLKIKRLIYY